MLDKNVTKYININEKMIIAGQTSGGIWYIKELPANNTQELEQLIGECNKICNHYNQQNTNVKKTKNKALPPTPTKGKGME